MYEPQITVSGHLGADPVLRSTSSGVPVTDFRIATTPRREVAPDEWADGETMWFRVTAWRGLAENVAASLHKGDRVTVVGRLGQSTWERPDGTLGVTFELNASSVNVDLSRCTVAISRKGRPVPVEDVWGDRWVNTSTGELSGPLPEPDEVAA